jgi:hypothetical protein
METREGDQRAAVEKLAAAGRPSREWHSPGHLATVFGLIDPQNGVVFTGEGDWFEKHLTTNQRLKPPPF